MATDTAAGIVGREESRKTPVQSYVHGVNIWLTAILAQFEFLPESLVVSSRAEPFFRRRDGSPEARTVAWEIPPPAGANAGVRDDGTDLKLS